MEEEEEKEQGEKCKAQERGRRWKSGVVKAEKLQEEEREENCGVRGKGEAEEEIIEVQQCEKDLGWKPKEKNKKI